MKNKVSVNVKPTAVPSNEANRWVTLILGLTLLMLPAMGVPSEELLQDTFKSALLTFGILGAFFLYFWYCQKNRISILIHYSIYLPGLLCIYAVGSMMWSHTFLAGVETIRWFLLTVLFFTLSNNLNLANPPRLAWGIHIGLTIASVWTALQFWFGLSIFPQGPNPASTFVNRNFFAEYCVGAIPVAMYLLVRERNTKTIHFLVVTCAFIVTTILMTGTRSALLALILIIVSTVFFIWRYLRKPIFLPWTVSTRITAISIFFGIILVLGFIPTRNYQLIQEVGSQTPLDRAFSRTASVVKASEYATGSFSIRAEMWSATLKMIAAHPLAGVGAGSWEVQAPLYQKPETQLETDFYAHNEFLQLIAEYGLIGWLFAVGLIYFLIKSIKATYLLTYDLPSSFDEFCIRFFSLLGLLTLLLVSNAGFPFRLAGTGALFAIYLSIIAASDNRINKNQSIHLVILYLSKSSATVLLFLSAILIIVASYITTLAIQCESNIIRAVKIALTITASKKPNDARWDTSKQEILTLINRGIAINPHYRKLTPIVADEMASWGDWEDAIGIWDSVLNSRPYVIALSANIAKGYIQLGNYAMAANYLKKAASIQPEAPAVHTVEALLFFGEGKYDKAVPLLHKILDEGTYDYQVLFTAYSAGTKIHDLPLVIKALELRIQHWPNKAADAWVKLGNIYSNSELKNVEKAEFCYLMAVRSSPPDKDEILAKIPSEYRLKASAIP